MRGNTPTTCATRPSQYPLLEFWSSTPSSSCSRSCIEKVDYCIRCICMPFLVLSLSVSLYGSYLLAQKMRWRARLSLIFNNQGDDDVILERLHDYKMLNRLEFTCLEDLGPTEQRHHIFWRNLFGSRSSVLEICHRMCYPYEWWCQNFLHTKI